LNEILDSTVFRPRSLGRINADGFVKDLVLFAFDAIDIVEDAFI
jgi:hypothetical protein